MFRLQMIYLSQQNRKIDTIKITRKLGNYWPAKHNPNANRSSQCFGFGLEITIMSKTTYKYIYTDFRLCLFESVLEMCARSGC